jgi:hypothetical protein
MISAKDRHVIDHIPVAILPLTLMQLVIDDLTADQALDSALRQKTSPTWLRREFERWLPVRGSGASRMLDLLEQWSGKRLPRSWFQRLAKQLFEAEGVQLEEEWPVQDAKGGLIAELDLAHVELKVGVECQSIQWHGAVSSRARDTERARKLRRLGWEIVEVWWADLHRSESVLADLQLALRKARQLRPHEDFGVADVAT